MLVLSVHKHFSNPSNHPSPYELLVKPSWLSAILGVTGSVSIIIGALSMLFYRSGTIQVLSQLQTKDEAPATNYQVINTDLASNSFLSNIPLLVFWAGVGIVAYFFTMAIVNALRSAAELESEMTYVHARRGELIRYAFERLGIRLVALILWLLYLQFTVHTIIPYAIAVSFAGTLETSWLTGGLYVLAGIAILCVSAHAHAILIRLTALRPRLFG
jgi:hypothetical protein